MKQYKRAYIEITNICNLDCSFCPKTKREKRYMTIKEFEYIINQIKDFTNYIYLHIMGEPTIHKNLKEFLDIAYDNNLHVNITTNGTSLGQEEIVKTLLNAKSLNKISISLHSFEANKLNYSLSDYLKNIVLFCKTASEGKRIITALRLWNLDNENVKGDNLLNDEIITILNTVFNKDICMENLRQLKGDFKLAHNTYLQIANKFEWPKSYKKENNDKVFCYGLRNQFGILVDGTVVPCCLDNDGNINLGNILDLNLNEILNSKRANDIYNGFSNRKAVENLCKNCQYAKRF